MMKKIIINQLDITIYNKADLKYNKLIMKKSRAFVSFLISLFAAESLWSQSAKDKWSIFGVELGTLNRTDGAKVNSNGEIIWTNGNRQWEDFGWDLRGIDLSDYEGIKIVLAESASAIPIDSLKLDNGYSPGNWLYRETLPGQYVLYFDGRGKNAVWGSVDEMDSSEGFEIFFTVPGQKKNFITKIKSVELLKKGSSKFYKNLAPFDIPLGTTNLRAFVEGNTIYWKRGYNDSSSGWDFTGIDLSKYDRVRVEIEESDNNLNLILCDGKWKNWHCYFRIAPNIFEVPLSAEGARWVDTDAHPFNLKEGLMVMLQKQDEEVRKTETSTVVKSIRFLKKGEDLFDAGKLGILNRAIGVIQENSVLSDNKIIWQKDNTELKCGWNLVGCDLSEYKGVRIEFEKNDLRLELTMADKNWQNWAAFRSDDAYTIEAYFSGDGAAWKWNDFKPFDKKQGVLLFLRFYSDKPIKKDKQTIIKRVELIK